MRTEQRTILIHPHFPLTIPTSSTLTQGVVVVSGAGPIGLAVARRLGKDSTLLLADESLDQLVRTVGALEAEGLTVYPMQINMLSRESVQSILFGAISCGSVKTVVHAASLSEDGPGVEADHNEIYSVNVLGTAYILDTFLKIATPDTSLVVVANVAYHLLAEPLPAAFKRHLANCSSDKLLDHVMLASASTNTSNDSMRPCPYEVTQSAMVLRVQGAARAFGVRGTRINAVVHGATFLRDVQENIDSETATAVKSATMYGIGSSAVAFLASEEASFVNATSLVVDGGLSAAVEILLIAASGCGTPTLSSFSILSSREAMNHVLL
ncbi:hypothetical protein BDW74DRAFT_183877 [Aspergillus multicolor]|uniref:uncharacterized protein n=1 Tax=Aspergillus multicolor TaxID=41759 RepID=UPI003CCE3230